MLLGVEFTLFKIRNKEAFFSSKDNLASPENKNNNKTKSSFKNDYSENLKTFIHELIPYADKRFKSSTDSNLLIVPDWLSSFGGELILKQLPSATLIWRSVLLCLGYLKKCKQPLDDSTEIKVIDHNSVSAMTTKLMVRKNNRGDYVPIHFSFYNGDSQIRKDYYTNIIFNNRMEFNILDDILPINFINNHGYFKNIKEKDDSVSISINGNIETFDAKILLEEGARYYLWMTANNVVPYYEELLPLNLVIFNKSEELVLFKNLVDKIPEILPAGRRTEPVRCDGISIGKGQTEVSFDLRFGDSNSKGFLREVTQQLKFSNQLLDRPNTIELVLSTTINPGQGIARVEVEQKDLSIGHFLDPVLLDWETMKKAYMDDGRIKTLEILQDELKRSFPVDIPPVKSVSDKVVRNWNSILRHISPSDIQRISLGRSSWPLKNNTDISRFQRTNIFGNFRCTPNSEPCFACSCNFTENNTDCRWLVNDGYCKYNQSDKYKNEIKRLFNYLHREFRNGNTSRATTCIGWTYRGDEFSEVVDDIRYKLKYRDGLSTQAYTCIANLFSKEDDLRLFFNRYIERINSFEAGNNNWHRAAYQVLMVHTTFLKDIKVDDLNLCVSGLFTNYMCKMDSPSIVNNIDRVVLFLLKKRRYYSSFCRLDSKDERDAHSYRLINLMLLNPQAMKTQLMIYYWQSKESLKLPRAIFEKYYWPIKREIDIYSYELLGKGILSKLSSAIEEYYISNDRDSEAVLQNKALELGFIKGKESAEKIISLYKENLTNAVNGELETERVTTSYVSAIEEYLNGRGNLNLPLFDEDDEVDE